MAPLVTPHERHDLTQRKKTTMTIAVFGATGTLGGHVLDALTARGVAPGDVRAVGRNTERLAELADRGFATAAADNEDRAAVDAAVEGATQVLLISGDAVGSRVPQHRNVVESAVAHGVEHLVYTSAPHARDTALVLAPEHRATEDLIEASGIRATILRNGWYTENYRAEYDAAGRDGVIANSIGEGRVASAPRADFGEAAAVVLTTPDEQGRVIELAGDSAWSFAEFAAAAGRVLGREVTYRPLTPEQERAALSEAGLDAGTADFVVALNANVREGLLGADTTDLSRLLGRPTVPLEETLRSW